MFDEQTNGKLGAGYAGAKVDAYADLLREETQSPATGSYGIGLDVQQAGEVKCARPGLWQRTRAQRAVAEGEVGRAMRLAELERLFEKHPDIARILDLIDLVR